MYVRMYIKYLTRKMNLLLKLHKPKLNNEVPNVSTTTLVSSSMAGTKLNVVRFIYILMYLRKGHNGAS